MYVNYAQQIYQCIYENREHLEHTVSSSSDINVNTEEFTTALQSLTEQNCAKSFVKLHTCESCKKSFRPSGSRPSAVQHKPWFNDECIQKHNIYIRALKQFNRHRTHMNRIDLANKKAAYKLYEARLKRQFRRQEGNMLQNMKRTNPKRFYELFRKRKRRVDTNLSANDFYEFFSDMMSQTQNNETANMHTEPSECVYEELDQEFSLKEIQDQIRNLKSNKSPGTDQLVNELFILCEDILSPIILQHFNQILRGGVFPQSWCCGLVIPVYKKGNTSDPGNYRPITLMNHMAKLFTSVLNARLMKWSTENETITDSQFGFRSGFGTSDAVFAMHSIIQRYLNNKKMLYCCFVDYKKAFDSVDHSKLWKQLIKYGINGKLLKVIQSMYNQIKVCIKFNNEKSSFYNCFQGLVQGEAMSPFIFALFINDLEMALLHNNCDPIDINEVNIFLLMYADDTILMAENPEKLQEMLDALKEWTDEYGLTVNVGKTKIVIFRPSWQRPNVQFFYNDEAVDIVDSFSYLGLLLYYNGKFNTTQKHIADQAKKSVFLLLKEIHKHNFNIETLISLFDTYVGPILNYCSETWGYVKACEIEKVHTAFLKRIIGVKRCTKNAMIYSETGRVPLIIKRQFNMVKYWIKLCTTQNCILKSIYESELEDCNFKNSKNWLSVKYKRSYITRECPRYGYISMYQTKKHFFLV